MKCQAMGCSAEGRSGVYQRMSDRHSILERKVTLCPYHANIPSIWGKFRTEEEES